MYFIPDRSWDWPILDEVGLREMVKLSVEGGMRVVSLRRRGIDLHDRTFLQCLYEHRDFTLTVVFGTSATSRQGVRSSHKMHRWITTSARCEETQAALHRVTTAEHITNPLVCRYMSMEEVQVLPVIPAKPVDRGSSDQILQDLANAVDSGDLYATLEGLQSFGGSPPRLSNVLVAAYLSPLSTSIQFAGEEISECWTEMGVLMEQRLFSLLTLAWRRRHYFVNLALLKYDMYARSGMLRYLFSEHVVRKKKLRDTLPDFPPVPMQIVIDYMTPFYPHTLDMESIIGGNREPVEYHPGLVQGQVLSEERTRETFTKAKMRWKLKGQFIPDGDVYKPYDDHGVRDTPEVAKLLRRTVGRDRI
jgi:hypothetical protein